MSVTGGNYHGVWCWSPLGDVYEKLMSRGNETHHVRSVSSQLSNAICVTRLNTDFIYHTAINIFQTYLQRPMDGFADATVLVSDLIP